MGQAQDLSPAIHRINPALYLNNMDNKPVYHLSVMSNNALTFTRFYGSVDKELKEQSYHYYFLNARQQNWILELRLDQHDFRVSDGQEMQAIRSSDFGIKIYTLQKEHWKEVTKKTLPKDFLEKFQTHFPHLQLSSWGYYYYNQNPEQIIYPTRKRKVLHFERNGKKILCLAWRKNKFVWK